MAFIISIHFKSSRAVNYELSQQNDKLVPCYFGKDASLILIVMQKQFQNHKNELILWASDQIEFFIGT